MATMTAANRKAQSAIRLAERVADLIEKAGQKRPSMFDLAPIVTLWARQAESLRKRYENECSYEWACTDSYSKQTETAEKKLVESVNNHGLFAYLQTDCRGATLYVDSKMVNPVNYTSAVCVTL